MYSFVKYDGTRTHDLLTAGALPTVATYSLPNHTEFCSF